MDVLNGLPETVGQVRSNCAAAMDQGDLANISLQAICKRLDNSGLKCEIRSSAVHGIGLFNCSKQPIVTDTVFQVLSYGELYKDTPVKNPCTLTCPHFLAALDCICTEGDSDMFSLSRNSPETSIVCRFTNHQTLRSRRGRRQPTSCAVGIKV